MYENSYFILISSYIVEYVLDICKNRISEVFQTNIKTYVFGSIQHIVLA